MSTYTLVDNGHIFLSGSSEVFEISDVPIAPIWHFSAENTKTQSGLSDGNALPQLYDLVAGNHAVQATATKRPILKTNQINSKACVRFDGSDDYYTFLTNSLKLRTAIIVMKHNIATNTYAAVFSSSQAVLGSQSNYFDGQGSSTYFFRNDFSPLFPTSTELNKTYNGLSYVAPNTLLISTSYRILSFDLVKTLAADYLIDKLGVRSDTSFPISADIAEILIFDKRLSEGDREYYVNQLKTYYAL